MSGGQRELPFGSVQAGSDAILAETTSRIDELFRASSEPGAPPPWMALFDKIARHTHMAPFNLMLADIQRPGARYVAFPEKWREVGRQVKPGSIPIVVLWPFGPVRCAYELADTTGAPPDDEALSQIFGAPHKIKPGITVQLAKRVLHHDQIEIKFVSFAATQAGDARFTGTSSKPSWLVRLAEGLSAASRFTTLIHELAHIYLGHLGANGKKWSNRRPERLDVREFEAEAVAFIVGRRFGLNSNSAEYLRGYVKNDTIEHVSPSAIARAAGRIEQHAR